MRRSTRALLVSITLVVVPPPALAQSQAGQPPLVVEHRMKAEDSLALLAAEYYGNRRHAILIAAENGLSQGQTIAPGKVVRIPVDRAVVTDVGQTIAELAEMYLGDTRRARFLLGFNDYPPGAFQPDVSLPAGLELRVPLHVHHTLAPDETLAAVASVYFENPDKARLIREYNFLGEDAPVSGQELLVPVYHVSVHAPRRHAPDSKARQRVARRADMQRQTHAALAGARVAWNAGDYAVVRHLLNDLDTDYLDTELAVEAEVLMGSAHVAFGDEDRAEASFRKALAREPSHVLDAYRVSPKIRTVWQRAGGTVAGTR